MLLTSTFLAVIIYLFLLQHTHCLGNFQGVSMINCQNFKSIHLNMMCSANFCRLLGGLSILFIKFRGILMIVTIFKGVHAIFRNFWGDHGFCGLRPWGLGTPSCSCFWHPPLFIRILLSSNDLIWSDSCPVNLIEFTVWKAKLELENLPEPDVLHAVDQEVGAGVENHQEVRH